jgi:hypothetical protein
LSDIDAKYGDIETKSWTRFHTAISFRFITAKLSRSEDLMPLMNRLPSWYFNRRQGHYSDNASTTPRECWLQLFSRFPSPRLPTPRGRWTFQELKRSRGLSRGSLLRCRPAIGADLHCLITNGTLSPSRANGRVQRMDYIRRGCIANGVMSCGRTAQYRASWRKIVGVR